MTDKQMWPDRRLTELFGIEHPIIQAPMAGPSTPELAAAVSNAGGLGSLAFAMLSSDQANAQIARLRMLSNAVFNVNFFCHRSAPQSADAEARWRSRLAPYYQRFGLDPAAPTLVNNRMPFDTPMCGLVVATRPKVVSFHFGLPEPALLEKVKSTGAVVLSSATTVAEARWLETHGADAIIAQGYEAGGHRGMFLSSDPATQVGTMALVPQIVDAVRVPVIAAGGIADARGIAAAFALGAAGVQIGTAYLQCPEAKVSPLHRAALSRATDDTTALTNVFTGRPARGIVNRVMREIGPISEAAPLFPRAATAMAPLRTAAETQDLDDFTPLWSGQSAKLGRTKGAGDLTRDLASETLAIIQGIRR
jgi:nitronate monooxygenase